MIEYERVKLYAGLQAGLTFLAELRKLEPDHPDLPAIEGDILATRVFLDRLDPTEQLKKPRKFSEEQLKGLQKIGFDFVVEIKDLSIAQLSENPQTAGLIDLKYSNVDEKVKYTLPPPRQVAVNLSQLYLPGSDTMFFDPFKLEEDAIMEIKKRKINNGTLAGIDFGSDRASTLAQLDFEYQRRFKKVLIPDFFARTIDDFIDPTKLQRAVAFVGRPDTKSELRINGFRYEATGPIHRVILVATPSGNR